MELHESASGNLITKYVCLMECVCVFCKRPITKEEGMFIGLGPPYYCCLHKWCAPFFKFNGDWPHPMPMSFYNKTVFHCGDSLNLVNTSNSDGDVAFS